MRELEVFGGSPAAAPPVAEGQGGDGAAVDEENRGNGWSRLDAIAAESVEPYPAILALSCEADGRRRVHQGVFFRTNTKSHASVAGALAVRRRRVRSVGCSISSANACSAMLLSGKGSRAPYFRSPRSGVPNDAHATRSWCGRPVSGSS